MSAAKKQRGEPVSGADIAVIQNVLNTAMVGMDSAVADGGSLFASCFAADGTVDILINGARKQGTAELAALAVFLNTKFGTCRHWEGNVCVSANDDGTASNTSYWKALDGGEVVSTGIHRDTLVRTGTGTSSTWVMQARVIEHTWTKAGGHRK